VFLGLSAAIFGRLDGGGLVPRQVDVPRGAVPSARGFWCPPSASHFHHLWLIYRVSGFPSAEADSGSATFFLRFELINGFPFRDSSGAWATALRSWVGRRVPLVSAPLSLLFAGTPRRRLQRVEQTFITMVVLYFLFMLLGAYVRSRTGARLET